MKTCYCLEAYLKMSLPKKIETYIDEQVVAKLITKELWHEVTKYSADPDLCAPHITGGAIDLRLLDANNNLVDMGTDINTIGEASYLLSSDISPIALAHRKILLSGMLHSGFAPMPTEWWHFSYGDKYWGAFYNRFAIFDAIKTPETFMK